MVSGLVTASKRCNGRNAGLGLMKCLKWPIPCFATPTQYALNAISKESAKQVLMSLVIEVKSLNKLFVQPVKLFALLMIFKNKMGFISEMQIIIKQKNLILREFHQNYACALIEIVRKNVL